MKNKKNVIVFAKEKHGLEESLEFLKGRFSRVSVFKGNRGDSFPGGAYKNNYDICISYMSPWIISEKMLLKVKEFSINFHPGPPEYRGIGCTNFAVYNNEPCYGVTAHLMAPKVDSGKIISVRRFPVSPQDSLVDITRKCYQNIHDLFLEVINYYLEHGALPASEEKWSARLYTRKELDGLCMIRKGMTKAEVKRRIKATDFPNMPKAYVKIFGFHFEYKGP